MQNPFRWLFQPRDTGLIIDCSLTAEPDVKQKAMSP